MSYADDLGGEAECDPIGKGLSNRIVDTMPSAPGLHLLRDGDLEELRPVLQLILDHRAEVVRQWCGLYLAHLGDSRSLSESEFMRLFEPALEQNMTALLNRDLDEYSRRVMNLGRSLVERRLPLDEAIAAFRLFGRSAQRMLSGDPVFSGTRLLPGLDKLNYLRIMLLATAYFSSRSGIAAEHLTALDREAELLPAASRTRFRGLVGASAAMRALYRRIEEAAAADNVLIVGERGTGRELVARALHACGPRVAGPFVSINCAVIPAELIEDELFGSAGDSNHAGCLGLVRTAEGGSIFVDDITQASPATQSKLARVVRERAVYALGMAGEQAVDVQFIAGCLPEQQISAMQSRLQQEVLEGLSAPVLVVPPLRERREDIELLTEHFIAGFNWRLQRKIAGIEREAMEAMTEHSWPGNVEELGEAIGLAFGLGAHPVIGLEDLPAAVGHGRLEAKARMPGTGTPAPVTTFAEAERDLIRRALESTGGNKVHTANLLKISRKKLYAKMEKYALFKFT